MICPNCSKDNLPGVMFCESCGAQLPQEPAATFSEVQPTAPYQQPPVAPYQAPDVYQDPSAGLYQQPAMPYQQPAAPYQQPGAYNAAPYSQPGYPQMPYGQPGFQDPAFLEREKKNGLAIASMILGILGIFICWVSYFWGMLVGVVGLVLGATSLNSNKKAFAIAGLACGVVAAVGGLFGYLSFF